MAPLSPTPAACRRRHPIHSEVQLLGELSMSKKTTHSGGGRTPVRVGVRAAPPVTRAVPPAQAANIGVKKGSHVSDGGGREVKRPADPIRPKTEPVRMGNDLA